MTDNNKKINAGEKLLSTLENRLTLFYDANDDTFAQINVEGVVQLWPIRSKRFTQFLNSSFYRQEKKGLNRNLLDELLCTLEAKAIHEGKFVEVSSRIAKDNEKTLVDLCNSKWDVVEVGNGNWKVSNDNYPKLVRTQGMLDLPEPNRNGDIAHLWSLLNVHEQDDKDLILAWLIAALTPNISYPLIVVSGEQGSAKTTTTKLLKTLIDPHDSILRSLPKNEQDLFIMAKNSHVLAFDNMSGLNGIMSDALCKISTGGAFGARKLYSDDEERVIKAQRPVILNGIDDFITRQDLIDRSILLKLKRIPEEGRRLESGLWKLFSEAHPEILGGLMNLLKQVEEVKPTLEKQDITLPRMSDYGLIGLSIEHVLKWPKGRFMKAYEENKRSAVTMGLDEDPTAQAIQMLIASNESFFGTSTELLHTLKGILLHNNDNYYFDHSNFPKNPQGLSRKLGRISAGLRKLGIAVEKESRTAVERQIRIYKV